MAPLAIYLFRTSADIRAKIMAMGIFVLTFVAVIGTRSRGGLICLIVLFIGLAYRSKQKLRNLLFLTVLAGGVLLVADAEWFSRMQSIENASQDTSFLTRVKAWSVAYHMGLKYPLLGAGGSIQYYPLYNSSFIASEIVEKRHNGLLATHNAYLEILAGDGFIAFGAFLGMIGTAILWCSKIYKATQNIPGLLWAAELGIMLQISLIVYAVGSMALSTEYWAGLWICMALVVSLREMVLNAAKFQPQPVT